MSDSVLFERRGRVGVVTLNAPEKRNALSSAMRVALRDRLQHLGIDKSCSAIVLTGSGGHFCAGGDISEMVDGAADPLVATHRMHILHDAVRAVVGGNKPVIAAVEGVAAGAGFSFAAACDFVVAAKDSKFIASFVRIGVAPDCGLQFTLAARAGAAVARQLLLTGKPVPATVAAEMGIVDELVEPGQALSRAVQIAEEMALLPPLALAMIKSSFASMPSTLEEALTIETYVQARLGATADHAEAKAAFMEKRPAVFNGR